MWCASGYIAGALGHADLRIEGSVPFAAVLSGGRVRGPPPLLSEGLWRGFMVAESRFSECYKVSIRFVSVL